MIRKAANLYEVPAIPNSSLFLNSFLTNFIKCGIKTHPSKELYNFLYLSNIKNKNGKRDLENFIKTLSIPLGFNLISIKGKKKLISYPVSKKESRNLFIKLFIKSLKELNKLKLNQLPEKMFQELSAPKSSNLSNYINERHSSIKANAYISKAIFKKRKLRHHAAPAKKKIFSYI